MLCLLWEALFRYLRARIPAVHLCAQGWSSLSRTGQLVWIFQQLWERDPLHPIDISTRGILRYHLVQLQLTPENSQQKQMLGLQPPSASQRCFEEPIIQFKIQFSLEQLTRLACIPTEQPGEATTGKFMTAVEALVGKLSPVQPWNQCLFHSFRHTTSPVLRVNSTQRLWG